tara:strand:- start:662 stop:1465 length:804 start_codon:yes stop_codon:yes gene_type:complete
METVGKIIRENRKAKNLSVEDVSYELKISKDILIKIENDKLKKDADIVFYLGHLRSYSNFLDLDTNVLIEKFKSQISFSVDKSSEFISKPKVETKSFNIDKFFSFGLILIIFTSFYFLFIDNRKQRIDYALIPDLPESLVPIIEESSLSNDKDLSKETKELEKNIIDFSYSKAYASKDTEENQNNEIVTLKILNSTWIQIRDKSDNIILSKLMNKNEEYTYNLNKEYSITSGNAGNILVIIDKAVRGKIGKYGEVLDSFTIDKNFNN